MISRLAIPNVTSWRRNCLILAAFIYIAIGVAGLSDYVNLYSISMLIGFLTIIQVIRNEKALRVSSRYAFLSLFFSLVCLYVPGRTFLYFSLSAAMLFLAEFFLGGLTFRSFLVVILASPIFKYASDVFSFPIRLQLTSWAASILSFWGKETQAIGNIIAHNGVEMSVDPECMGLNMMVTSTLSGVMIISVFGKRFQKQVPIWMLVCYIAILVLLNTVSNLLRIVTLVHLSIPPRTLGHEILGIICFIIYVIVPGIFLARWMVKNAAICANAQPPHPTQGSKSQRQWLHIPIIILLCFSLVAVKHHDTEINTAVPLVQINGYSSARMTGEIIKLENKQSLVYLKYIAGFYNTDHNPMICWKGSGYNFSRVRKEEMNGSPIYIGELNKDGDKLATAWWYENGYNRTIAQLEWRKDVLSGARNYYLVNVTAESYDQLANEVKKLQCNPELVAYFRGQKNQKSYNEIIP